MRTRVAGLFVVLTTLVVWTPSAGAGRPPTGDWLLIVMDGGDTGTPPGSAGASGGLVLTGGPWVSGLGGSHPRQYAGVSVFTNAGADPVDVATSRDAGGLSLHVTPSQLPNAYEFGMGAAVPELAPHERAYALFFDGNARLTFTKLEHTPGLHVRFVVGRGTTVIRHADPRDSGVSLSAGPVAAAALATHVERPRVGIVGGVALPVMLLTGLPTTGSWAGPGGRHGDWVSAPVLSPQAPFAGPAGRWTWSWSGVQQGPAQAPVVAAFAPVGAVWPAFVPTRP